MNNSFRKGNSSRVRFFNTYEPVTTFFRDLLPYLAERRIACEVLISAAEYRQGGRGKLSEAFSDPKIQVQYLPALRLQPSGRARKAVIMLAYVLASMWKTLFGAATNLNFFLTQPPLFNLWGWVLKKIRRQPYLYLVMDIYPDVAVMGGILSRQGFLTKVLIWMSRFALHQVDAVVVIGRCMAERVEATGVDPEKIHLIPNWANPDIIFPVPPSGNCLHRELGLDGKFVVLYSGNMGVSHYFDDLLEVIQRCRNEPSLHFVFIGEGTRRKEIENFLVRHKLQNVTLLPFQPMERMAESLSLGDAHFISLREGFEGLVVPSKVYGALAAGRPVIYQGNTKGEIARMVKEEDIGTVVQSNAPGQLEQVIRDYLKPIDRARQQGMAARRLVEGKYAPRIMLERYYQIISRIGNA